MPIRPENRHRYPPDWPLIRRRILERAGHRCEGCNAAQYAIGYRDKQGRFRPAAGNGPCDMAGDGRHWPSGDQWTYGEAVNLLECFNDFEGRCDWDGRHWIIIVLTIAHLDHTPENNDPENLRAWCQKCHLDHDREHHLQQRAIYKQQEQEREGQQCLQI